MTVPRRLSFQRSMTRDWSSARSSARCRAVSPAPDPACRPPGSPSSQEKGKTPARWKSSGGSSRQRFSNSASPPPRESHDDGGPQHQVRNGRVEVGHHLPDQGRCPPGGAWPLGSCRPGAGWECPGTDDLGLPGDDVDEVLVDLIGVEVVEPDPVEGQPAQLRQELPQPPAAVEVGAVAGDVLGDDDELPDPPLRQAPGLLQQGLEGPAAVAAPEGGDDTVGAAVVTALRDLEVGGIAGVETIRSPSSTVWSMSPK